MTMENAINEIEQLKIEISKINVKLINIISEYISNVCSNMYV